MGGAIFSFMGNLTISGSSIIVGNRAGNAGGGVSTIDIGSALNIDFGPGAVVITGNTPTNVICFGVRLVM